MKYEVNSLGSFPLLHINQMGYSADPSVTRYGPARRNSYIIHYVLSGRGYFLGKEVVGGQGFLIRPGQEEFYRADLAEPWGFLWIISNDESMEKIFETYHANEDGIFNYDYVTQLYDVVQRLKKNSNRIMGPCEILELFLSVIKNSLPRCSEDALSVARNYAKTAKEYIDMNYYRDISIKGIADMLSVSRTYLYKIFRNTYRTSPKEYLGEVRIEKAKAMLRETGATITEIANSVGYGDVLDFSKFFSRKCGISPSAYKNKMSHQVKKK